MHMHIRRRRLDVPDRPVRWFAQVPRHAGGARRETTERFCGEPTQRGRYPGGSGAFGSESNLEILAMKMVKSLMLGSAAGLIAMSGAQAADLPLKAKAVEYVRICSLYGAGFYYIPGTDTCIKLGGYVRADVGIMGGDYGFMQGVNQGSNNRLTQYWTQRSRTDLTVDTRTATEYGVVR